MCWSSGLEILDLAVRLNGSLSLPGVLLSSLAPRACGNDSVFSDGSATFRVDFERIFRTILPNLFGVKLEWKVSGIGGKGGTGGVDVSEPFLPKRRRLPLSLTGLESSKVSSSNSSSESKLY